MTVNLPSGYALTSPSTKEEFEKYFSLRWKVLREPWNQPHGSERDELENSAYQLAVLNAAGEFVACGRLQFNDAEIAQIRYMAVRNDERGKDLGKAIMEGLEAKAKAGNAKKIFLQAREGAVAFYLSCGYEIIEKTFLLYDEIQHFSMEKIFDDSLKDRE